MKLLFRLTFLLMCIIVTSCTDSFEEPECARDYIPESFAKTVNKPLMQSMVCLSFRPVDHRLVFQLFLMTN